MTNRGATIVIGNHEISCESASISLHLYRLVYFSVLSPRLPNKCTRQCFPAEAGVTTPLGCRSNPGINELCSRLSGPAHNTLIRVHNLFNVARLGFFGMRNDTWRTRSSYLFMSLNWATDFMTQGHFLNSKKRKVN